MVLNHSHFIKVEKRVQEKDVVLGHLPKDHLPKDVCLSQIWEI